MSYSIQKVVHQGKYFFFWRVAIDRISFVQILTNIVYNSLTK